MKRTLAVVGMVVRLVLLSAALAAEPAPAPAAEQAGPPAAELLKYSPPGTWAVLAVDCAAIRSSQLGEAVHMGTLHFLGATVVLPAVDRFQAFTVFVLPVQKPLDESVPNACGIAKLPAGARQKLEKQLGAPLGKTTFAGRDAYMVRGGGAGLVFADDQTVVWGLSAESLDAILKAYESPVGPGARLAELLKSGNGDTVRGAVAFPQDLKAMLSPEAAAEAPPFWLGTTGGALNVGVQKGLQANLRLLMANPTDAANAARMVTASIQSVKDRLAAMSPRADDPSGSGLRSSRLVFESINVQAVGSEVRFDLSLSEEELEKLRQDPQSALGRARVEARKSASQMNLLNIGLGIAMYRAAHDDAYPHDLTLLLTEGNLDGKEALLDPSDTKPVPIGQNGPPCSYEYVGPIPRGAHAGTIIAYTRKGIYPDGRLVLCDDGMVTWASEADVHSPQGIPRASLPASHKALMDACGADMSDEQKARLKVFFEIE